MITAALTCVGAGAAQAGWLDIDDEAFFQPVDPGTTVEGTFDIVNPGGDCILVVCDQGGFTPGTDVASEGYVVFAFHGWSIEYTIELGDGGQSLTDPAIWSVLGLHIEVGSLDDSSLSDLSLDGMIDWALTNEGNHKFKLKFAKLVAHAGETVIPEPQAFGLFSAGFLIVGTAVRRRSRS